MRVVELTDTAAAVGSGRLEVLGTPRLLAWCEAETCRVIDPELDDETTSVGTDVRLQHLAPSAVGASVEVTAVLSEVDGRVRRFDVWVRDPDTDVELAIGVVTRSVVDIDRFMKRVG